MPGFHSKTPSSNEHYAELMRKYIRYSTNNNDGNETPWQKLINEIDHNKEENVNILGHQLSARTYNKNDNITQTSLKEG